MRQLHSVQTETAERYDSTARLMAERILFFTSSSEDALRANGDACGRYPM